MTVATAPMTGAVAGTADEEARGRETGNVMAPGMAGATTATAAHPRTAHP